MPHAGFEWASIHALKQPLAPSLSLQLIHSNSVYIRKFAYIFPPEINRLNFQFFIL